MLSARTLHRWRRLVPGHHFSFSKPFSSPSAPLGPSPSLLHPATRSLFRPNFPAQNYSMITAEKMTEEPPKMDKLFERIHLEVSGNEPEVIKSYMLYVKNVCRLLGIEASEPGIPPGTRPYKKYILCINRAKFAKKKYKLHYEMRTYKRIISVYNLTGSTASTFLEYIQRNIPEGVAMMVEYTELRFLPESIPAAEEEEQDEEKRCDTIGEENEQRKP